MLTTIEFDNQFSFDADEVSDVGPDRELPPELAAAEGTVAQMLPETGFGVC